MEEKISQSTGELEQLQEEMTGKKNSMELIKPAYERFTNWADEFDSASLERKKMIIGQLISRIEIGRGYKINIEFNVDYEQFCENMDNLNESVNIHG